MRPKPDWPALTEAATALTARVATWRQGTAPGRHARARHRAGEPARPLTGVLAVVVITGGIYFGLAHAQAPARPDSDTVADVRPENVARGERPILPAAPPSASPSPSPPPSPSAKPSPARTVRVTQSGSCGASFYDEPQGTASGEVFDPEALTAAHKTLPFNSKVRVTNPANGKSVTVRINDRGPYIDGRCLDLSRAAFREIADLDQGVLRVVDYEVLG